MPFIDKSTLTYPATNSFPVRKWLDQDRAPTSNDFRNFQIFDLWIHENVSAWIMIDRTATSGTWIQMASTGTGILTVTGDAGGAVGPDGANNINLLSGSDLTITGNPGTNTLTVTLDGTIANTYTTDAGNAIPAANVLNILGTGGLSTSGAGNTVTITAGPTIPTTFTTDAGVATPVANNLNVFGSAGIQTTGIGADVLISVDATIAQTYTGNVGVATPAANNLNILGTGGITVTGAADTLTISGGAIPWTEVVVVGPTAMAVNNGYVANNGARVQLTLPLTSAFGSVIEVAGKGAGGWEIDQNAGQNIDLVSSSTTVGVGGKIQSSESGATLRMVCITADTTWRVLSSTGNFIIT